MTSIHPTAIVDARATISPGVEIGPYCIVGPDVVLGDDCRLISHVVIDGRTQLGKECRVHPFAVIGQPPQDMKYRGEPSELFIGARTVIREHVTLNPGTERGGMVTRVGTDCLLMATTHVAHDCQVGNHVVMANNATLGGHVHVGDHAVLGGLSAIHQYVRIGHHAMIGGMSGVERDVIPYGSVMGNRAHLSGLNTVGMKRRGIGHDEIIVMRQAYRMMFESEGTFADRLAEVAELFADRPRVMEIVSFIREATQRSICTPERLRNV
ncbi:MAG: acyl-ACP--UDP-N-acetylglucosamine O-acyltransferase [Geminicoccaceae bacterium]|nr:acyl-ACP--UDP-N-acetylglucosamine O-acyltransferase [Geminicoccaceae bacterium]MCB9944646.1 acyl-ACP--UDP-N-acetylglucosamine O-acyltransferase [Geminicoccaceae bacterium]